MLACVVGAEGYCNHFVCLRVLETNNIGTLIELLIDFKIYLKNRFSLKQFSYIVMTIFITHNYHFTTFRRLLVAKKYMKTQCENNNKSNGKWIVSLEATL